MLRLRRHVRGQERRHVHGDARRQAAPRARHARRGLRRRRQLLPDAHRRRAQPPAPGCARCTSPRSWRSTAMSARRLPGGRRGRALARRPAAPQPRQGDDARSAPSARRSWASCPTGRQLRDAGAAIKARALATPARAARAARGGGRRRRRRTCTGRATRPRRTRSSPGSRAAHGAREVIKVKSIATDEIGLNDALEAGGHRARSRRTSPSSSCSSPATGPRTSSCRRSTATARRSASCSRARSPAARRCRASRRRSPRPARRYLRERSSSRRRMAVSGANFAVAETGHGLRRRVRGQRPLLHDAAGGARHGDGDREGASPSGATSR